MRAALLLIVMAAPTTARNLVFTQKTGANNPFDGVDLSSDGGDSAPTCGLSTTTENNCIFGTKNGPVHYYHGSGSPMAWMETTGTKNPFNSESAPNGNPACSDLNANGEADCVFGSHDGTLKYYKHSGEVNGVAVMKYTDGFTAGKPNPFKDITVGANAAPTFADFDGDGDFDVLIGNGAGAMQYFKNTGDKNTPTFVEEDVHAMTGVDVGDAAAPSCTDFDSPPDGLIDCVVGTGDGKLKYYKNDGTAASPSFAEKTGADNPFNGLGAGITAFATPSYRPANGLGFLLIGGGNGKMEYYAASLPAPTAAPTGPPTNSKAPTKAPTAAPTAGTNATPNSTNATPNSTNATPNSTNATPNSTPTPGPAQPTTPQGKTADDTDDTVAIVLIVILLLLAAVAGYYGYIWYKGREHQSQGITVQGDKLEMGGVAAISVSKADTKEELRKRLAAERAEQAKSTGSVDWNAGQLLTPRGSVVNPGNTAGPTVMV